LLRVHQPRSASTGRSWPGVVAPLVLFVATVGASSALQHPSFGPAPAVSQPLAETPDASGRPAASPDQDDPQLALLTLNPRAVDEVAVPSVQVLPAGNVLDPPVRLVANILPSTRTRWVRNTSATTLWSGSNAAASAFTDVPGGSFFRATGPEVDGRLAVYYVGDGLLRRPGNGWVDASRVETVDAPPPGQDSAVDADASRPLPVWVQAHRATSLWSGPDSEAVRLTDLPQWTFLKIAGLERGERLLVNYAGDYASRQSGIGWVDQSAVGPAGDPGRWVTNHRATALWSGVDDNALHFTDLPQWTKLRIVEGAPPDSTRMQVEFFGDGLARQPGVAWIARADVGPITPPVPLPARPASSADGAQIGQHTFASPSEFIDTVGAAAQRSRKSTGVPASVTVAQAILESDWGRSRLTRQGNNLFGIKALGSVTGPAGVVTLATWEYVDGGAVVVQAPFKAYKTLEQSIDDHGGFFVRNRRYGAALAVANDARAFARAIQDAGYATDPSYAAKLIGLMDRYNLYRFDS
jgi:Mannosyl-glycoprotein endo-beta-N-acetylglucosaminidase